MPLRYGLSKPSSESGPKLLVLRASWWPSPRPNDRGERLSSRQCSFPCFGAIALGKRKSGWAAGTDWNGALGGLLVHNSARPPD